MQFWYRLLANNSFKVKHSSSSPSRLIILLWPHSHCHCHGSGNKEDKIEKWIQYKASETELLHSNIEFPSSLHTQRPRNFYFCSIESIALLTWATIYVLKFLLPLSQSNRLFFILCSLEYTLWSIQNAFNSLRCVANTHKKGNQRSDIHPFNKVDLHWLCADGVFHTNIFQSHKCASSHTRLSFNAIGTIVLNFFHLSETVLLCSFHWK